jgi:vitamin B12 transporter
MNFFSTLRSVLVLGYACLAPEFYAAPADTYSDQIRDEIIVTATRLPLPVKSVGSAVTVITAEDIAQRKTTLASDLLREVPGLAVSRAGQVGAVTQVRMRGAEGNHTLVLIDGIEANNPALGFEFNFADMLTYDLERIEVLRGPQSALYGSEAIGGVISLETRGKGEAGFSAHGEVQGGSYNSTSGGATLAASGENAFGSFSAMHYTTDGISSSAIQPERDGYETTTVHTKFGYSLSDQVSVKVVLRHADNENDIDQQDFAFPSTPTQGLVIDTNDTTESSQLYGLVQIDANAFDDRWLNTLRYSYVDTESEAFIGAVFDNGNDGRRRKIEYQTSYLFGSGLLNHALTFGGQFEALEFSNRFPAFPGATYRAEDDQTSLIGEYTLSSNSGWALSASVRQDNNDRFDDASTFRLAGSYLLSSVGSRFHASLGEGITNPSFFELFGFSPSSFSGNPGLQPEKSLSWDVGLEQALFDGRALVDVTYFNTNLEDEIATVFDFSTFLSTAENLQGESDREGVEVSGSFQINESWHTNFSYTYLDATEPNDDVEVRRPDHNAAFNLNHKFFSGRGNANLGLIYNGKQQDSEFIFATPIERVELDAYTLLNLAATFDVNEAVEVFARVENLLDEDYVEVFGFRSPGRAGYVGVRAKF